MSPVSHLLILSSFFLLSPLIAFADGSNDDSEEEFVKLDLMHRHHPEVVKRLQGEIKVEEINDRIKNIHDHDHQRHRSITASLNRKQVEEKLKVESFASVPTPSSHTLIGLKMISGADFGESEYFVQLKVGTPPQTFMLIADTGSDLTWMKCRYRRCMGNCSGSQSHSKNHNERKEKSSYEFFANHSSSFSMINCGSKRCSEDFSELFSIRDCQVPTNPCRYDYSYAGGSSARGIFATETLTVTLTNGREKQLKNSIIGCTESMQGKVFKGADGIVGLGTSIYSFPYKAAENAGGGGFSYCLVDHLSDRTATSYFVLGSPSPKTVAASTSAAAGPTSSTKLFIGDPYSSFYGVDLIGISSDGRTLNIPPRVWDINAGGGTILDSGTSLTMLTAPAYDMVMETLTPNLKKFERILVEPFSFCFNGSQYQYNMTPKLRFHFGDGAVFEPPTKSYIVSAGDYVKCVGFISMPFPATNILGNILQQNHLWQFDFVKELVRFAPSNCV